MYTPRADDANLSRPRRPAQTVGLIGCGLVTTVLVIIVAQVFRMARDTARESSCHSNMMQLVGAIQMYAVDNDDCLPVADHWADQTKPYTKRANVYACPSLPNSPYGYAYSSIFAQHKLHQLKRPELHLLIYDSTAQSANANDRITSLPLDGRHFQSNMVGFADGHVRMMPSREKVKEDIANHRTQ